MVKVHVWKVEWCPTYGKYLVVLKEIEGERSLPIMVEEWEAQNIEVLLNQRSQQPYKTARLFSYLLENLDVKILRVEIHKSFRGELFAKVLYCDKERSYSISHSPGEAIELALRCRSFIMIPKSLLFATDSTTRQTKADENTLKLLKKRLEKAIEVENYEDAARLRDEILKLEKKMKCK